MGGGRRETDFGGARSSGEESKSSASSSAAAFCLLLRIEDDDAEVDDSDLTAATDAHFPGTRGTAADHLLHHLAHLADRRLEASLGGGSFRGGSFGAHSAAGVFFITPQIREV
ncbi:hypothetical protein TYRP_014629 [Tyrophagus putrescentiae]|nr:hypothetical protein TYRP_014629 [Tyrophagus putrescentiae]